MAKLKKKGMECCSGICREQSPPQGVKESKRVAACLLSSNIKPDIIFSSDLTRAKITAEILSETIGIKIEYDALLRERKAGTAEGKKEGEIDWAEYEKQPGLSRRHPDGESFEEVRARAEEFIRELSQNIAETAVVVSHSALLAMLVSLLSHTDPETCLKMDFRNFLTIVDTKKQGVERIPLPWVTNIDLRDMQNLTLENFINNTKRRFPKVLELGGGEGKDALLFLDRGSKEVWMIDKKDTIKLDPHVHFFQGDYSKTDEIQTWLPEESFDLLFSAYSLCFNTRESIEMFLPFYINKLKTGGDFLIFDFSSIERVVTRRTSLDSEWFQSLLAKYFEKIETRKQEVYEEEHDHSHNILQIACWHKKR